MAITTKTITGKIVIPGTTIGIRAEVTATPMTTATALTFPADDTISWGPVITTTNAAGVLTPGLVIPTSQAETAVMWRFDARPTDKHPGVPKTWTMGFYQITGTGTADLADLVEIDVTVIDPATIVTMQGLVSEVEADRVEVANHRTAVEAVVASNDGIMTSVDNDAASTFRVQQDARQAAPKWRASTAYTAGDIRQAPDGTTIRRNTAGTSAATFTLTELATPVLAAPTTATTGGTIAAGATYFYKATALNALGETIGSTEVSRAIAAALTTPVNAAFTTATTGGTLAAGTYSYRVSATNAAGETLASTATTQTVAAALAAPVLAEPTTATTGGTLAAATYYYKATAINAVGETIGSNEVSIATTGTTSTVGLSWAAITGATGYKIYRATVAGGESTSPALVATLGAVTTYTDTGTAVSAGAVPATNTTATTTNTVTVNWGAVAGATGYKVYGRTAAGELLMASVGAVTTWTDTGAVTPAGALPASNTTATNTNTVGLSWAAITGATGYKIYRATATGGQSTSPALVASVGAVTTYTDTGTAVTAGAVPATGTTSEKAHWTAIAAVAGTMEQVTLSATFAGRTGPLDLTPGLSGNGDRVEIQKDTAPLNYGDTRAGIVLQVRDPQALGNNQMAPGAVFQFVSTADGFVDAGAKFSGSIWMGLFAAATKYGDGSQHAFTATGELREVGAVGYNELGGFQGELTNVGSVNGNISGVELLIKDSPDGGVTSFDTALKAIIGRVAKYSATRNNRTTAFFASSEGSVAPDSILSVNGTPASPDPWQRGLDLSGASFPTGVAVTLPNNTNLSWLDSALAERPIFGVSSTNVTFMRPGSAAGGIELQNFAGGAGLKVNGTSGRVTINTTTGADIATFTAIDVAQLTVKGDGTLDFNSGITTLEVGAAGAASAMPTPAGYLYFYVGGVSKRLAYFN